MRPIYLAVAILALACTMSAAGGAGNSGAKVMKILSSLAVVFLMTTSAWGQSGYFNLGIGGGTTHYPNPYSYSSCTLSIATNKCPQPVRQNSRRVRAETKRRPVTQ